VQDQEEDWLLLQRLLENAGLQVQVAEDGADGIDKFLTWRPPSRISKSFLEIVVFAINPTQKMPLCERGAITSPDWEGGCRRSADGRLMNLSCS